MLILKLFWGVKSYEKKSNYIVDDVLNSEGFGKNDRVEWLQQLYAEWLEKRRFILTSSIAAYLINEPDELDIETYW